MAAPPTEEGAEGPYLLGKRSVPRAGALATSRVLQKEIAAKTGIFKEGLSAVKELLVSKENDPENVGSRPPSPKPDGEESRADKYRNACDDIGEPSFAALGTMFDPNMGGTCTDEKVTAWLAYLLIPEE